MAADSDNEMRDFTDSEGEQERWEEKTGTRAGIGLIKVQAVLRTEHLRKGYLPLKCVFLVTVRLRNDLYNVEPLKKISIVFLPSKTHKYFTCRSLSSFPHRNLITFQ